MESCHNEIFGRCQEQLSSFILTCDHANDYHNFNAALGHALLGPALCVFCIYRTHVMPKLPAEFF